MKPKTLARFLAAIKTSMKNAGLPDYRVLVVNDGSTDGTLAILDRLQE